MIQPPAQRADENQLPEAMRQRVCDGMAGIRVVLLRYQTFNGHARRNRTGIGIKIANKQIRRQTEPLTVDIAPVAGDDKITRLLLRHRTEDAAGNNDTAVFHKTLLLSFLHAPARVQQHIQ